MIYYWVANWNLARAQAATLLGRNVVDMVDCIHGNVGKVRECFPHVALVAGYDTGSSDIRWTSADWDEVTRARATALHIDQSDSDLPMLSEIKEAEDIESGAKKIGVAVTIAHQRHARGLDSVLYCSQSVLSELEDAIHADGLGPGEILAYQYADPGSNPRTVLPGTVLTLEEAPADLSVVRTEYVAKVRPPAPHLAVTDRAIVTYGVDDVIVTYDPAVRGWSLDAGGKRGWAIHPTTPGEGRA